MATTAKGLRYPLSSDTPAVHTDIQNLATDVGTYFQLIADTTDEVNKTLMGVYQ